MKKHHAKKQKKNHSNNQAHEKAGQAGFISIKDFMNRNDKIIVGAIGLGIVILLILSAVLIINRGDDEEQNASLISPSPEKRITTPYPTLPKEIKDTTVMVNRRLIAPKSVTIKVGGTVGFFNQDDAPVPIQGYDGASEIINLGPIQPFDIPVVVFPEPGVFKYLNPQNPDDVAEIIVEE